MKTETVKAKPDNCICLYPDVILRNVNGHDESCPVYQIWAKQFVPVQRIEKSFITGFIREPKNTKEFGKLTTMVCVACFGSENLSVLPHRVEGSLTGFVFVCADCFPILINTEIILTGVKDNVAQSNEGS